MQIEKKTKSSMESNVNEEMYEKDTRELLIAVGIGILLGILAYEVTLFVNLRISCFLMPGLAALCVGGAGLFVVGLFSFFGYEFYIGNKKQMRISLLSRIWIYTAKSYGQQQQLAFQCLSVLRLPPMFNKEMIICDYFAARISITRLI